MLFGSWEVNETGIEWKGKGFERFVIPLEKLNATKHDNTNNAVYYEWILLATQEDWLTQNDLYDLNYAFVYAFAKSTLNFSYDIFDATLADQYDQFDAEDNEDFEL